MKCTEQAGAHLDTVCSKGVLLRCEGGHATAPWTMDLEQPKRPSCGNRFLQLGCSASAISMNHQKDHAHALREDEVCEALYFSGTAPATDCLGPISVRDIPGKGRGLVAQCEMRPGDLVMAVQPVVVLHGQQDAMPSPEALVEYLEKSWPSLPVRHRSIVRQMFVGSIDTHARTTSNHQPPTDRKLPIASEARAAADAETAAGTCGDGNDNGAVDFRAIVSYNAYGDEYEDLPAADLRGLPPRSHVGLWPYFNQLNHACAPNCVHYVVGSTMVVRAVQVIPEGCELLVSYLGRDDLAPRQVRQAALKARYGFICNCTRCQTEAELPEELQALLQQLYDRAQHELAPRFERLAASAASAAEEEGFYGAAGPRGALLLLLLIFMVPERVVLVLVLWAGPSSGTQQQQQQLASLESRLEDCARQLHLAIQAPVAASAACRLPGSGRQLTRVQAAQAAAYQLMELLHLHAEVTAAAAAGGGRTQAAASGALQACWHVLDAISRGSELQVFQACKMLSDALQATSRHHNHRHGKDGRDRTAKTAERQPKSSPSPSPPDGSPLPTCPPPVLTTPPPDEVREAASLLGLSLLARYGKLQGQRLTRMTQAAIRTSQRFF
ncbi:hypothetical protein VOLCADRAFT_91197 [Volvox carteri f. nagariensis]|uniref:SET domain-containing protein n=1 Tax=Volvox carteri f. nagariensis TaxID=3068 RepID=D8TWF6_VOLCA|nr:uncharacterized protein VOLCADRAFT_91197 [Volvox carteri f. nagariensis]EFJ48038.1 hypothetical protein VOLCADRAFT_91197 [Volvox carteri f. nagariensis]|eukprot:XP_002950723.1 hypothetical protein VOLCADRAFT_91197 [Volvox carteri f. nagariensis]